MAKHKILVVDDEESLCEILQFNLEVEGYEVDVAYSAEQALGMHPERYSLILLDVMMGEMSGFRMARLLKDDPATAKVPVIFCTAKDSEDDTVAGLNLGADDYMRKPFPLDELLARVRVLLRRTQQQADIRKIIENGAFKLDTVEKEAWLRGSLIDLSPTEYSILEVLARRMGHTVSREELLRRIWGMSNCDTRTVDVHLSRLRKKLDDGRRPMLSAQTLRGRGYRLVWEEGQE